MTDTTCDAFLGGRLMLRQPVNGYRAGNDPVLLASAVPAKAGESVLELGCGVGAAILCLGTRLAGLALYAVEIQKPYAELCRANASENGINVQVHDADLRALPSDILALSFDHVMINPPYFIRGSGIASPRSDRDTALVETTEISTWINIATRRLKPKGQLTLIQKADRLPDVLRAIDHRLGSVCVVPIVGRAGRDADRFLLRARKGGRAAFRLCAPVHLHDGANHISDRSDYRPEIAAVLRNGEKFPIYD